MIMIFSKSFSQTPETAINFIYNYYLADYLEDADWIARNTYANIVENYDVSELRETLIVMNEYYDTIDFDLSDFEIFINGNDCRLNYHLLSHIEFKGEELIIDNYFTAILKYENGWKMVYLLPTIDYEKRKLTANFIENMDNSYQSIDEYGNLTLNEKVINDDFTYSPEIAEADSEILKSITITNEVQKDNSIFGFFKNLFSNIFSIFSQNKDDGLNPKKGGGTIIKIIENETANNSGNNETISNPAINETYSGSNNSNSQQQTEYDTSNAKEIYLLCGEDGIICGYYDENDNWFTVFLDDFRNYDEFKYFVGKSDIAKEYYNTHEYIE